MSEKESISPKVQVDGTDTATHPVLPHRWWTLATLALCVSLIVIDGTIVNVALPVMIQALTLSAAQAAWMTTIYALVFSALLITAGRVADRIGRRTVLLVGIVIFVIGSIIAATSGTGAALLIARAIQGLGGALVLPCTLSTVNATFFGADRRVAFAVWGSVIAGMAAVGPLLGGWLTTHVDWSWIFTINVPLGILLIIGVLVFVPQTKEVHAVSGFDTGGFVLSTLGFGALVFGLIQGREYGWWRGIGEFDDWAMSPAFLGLIAGALSLIGFWMWEQRRSSLDQAVLLDTRLFGLRSFAWGNLAALVVAMGEFGVLFVLPLHLQNVLGLSPLGSGWVLAAMAAGAFLSGGMAAHLSKAIGAPRVATLGLGLEVVGLALAALILRPTTSGGLVAGVLVIYGLGLGLASAQLTSVILVDVPTSKSGQGSAVQSTVRQVGTAMGIAVISTIFATSLATGAKGSLDDIEGLPPQAAAGIEQSVAPSLGGVVQSIAHPEQATGGHASTTPLPEPQRTEVVDTINGTITDASRRGIGVAAMIIAIGVAATLQLPRDTKAKA